MKGRKMTKMRAAGRATAAGPRTTLDPRNASGVTLVSVEADDESAAASQQKITGRNNPKTIGALGCPAARASQRR